MSEAAPASTPAGPVHRAFGLLQLVVAAGEPVGVRDLARRSGLSKSTTGRMLGILTELGMVERTPDGGATAGAALATLTTGADRSPANLRDRLRPLTVALRERYAENAAVAVDDGDALLYLASARVDAAVQVADPAGHRFDHHLVAPGLVAMAGWEADRLERALAAPLRAPTPHSVVDPAAIRHRLETIRTSGFAWTDQELDVDVNGVAAPILDHAGTLVAVATLYGPAYRLNPQRSPDLGPDLGSFVSERSRSLLDE